LRSGSSVPWVPFLGIKLHFFCLAYLVPGSYWINILFMLGFIAEFFLIWFSLHIGDVKSATLMFEPQMTLFCALIGAILLFYKYKDQKNTEKLITKSIRMDLYQDLSRVFIGLRDRMNTPLQNLIIVREFMKREHMPPRHLNSLESSTEALIEINKLLKRIDDDMESLETNIMQDAEIRAFLEKLEKEKNQRGPYGP
jgi:hypothetical protein